MHNLESLLFSTPTSSLTNDIYLSINLLQISKHYNRCRMCREEISTPFARAASLAASVNMAAVRGGFGILECLGWFHGRGFGANMIQNGLLTLDSIFPLSWLCWLHVVVYFIVDIRFASPKILYIFKWWYLQPPKWKVTGGYMKSVQG